MQFTVIQRRARGLTLIELILVVAILVALAGLLLPKLDGVTLKTNKGIAANNIASVNRYIQTYRVLHNLYPNNWDSLLLPAGTLAQATTATDIGLDPQLTGFPLPEVHHKLKDGTLTAGQFESLARMGIRNVQDWSATAEVPSNGFTIDRLLSATSKVAVLNVVVDPTTGLTTAGDGDAVEIFNAIYPRGAPSAATGPAPTQLVVFGFGPLNQAIGDVVDVAPRYSNTDPTHYYANFLAVFEVRENGHRALLKAALGADGDLLMSEVNEYFEAP